MDTIWNGNPSKSGVIGGYGGVKNHNDQADPTKVLTNQFDYSNKLDKQLAVEKLRTKAWRCMLLIDDEDAC